MTDFQTEQVVKLPILTKMLNLEAGESVSGDEDILAFAQMTVPTGKKAKIAVSIRVLQLEDA